MDPNLDDMLTERAQYLKLGNLVQLEAMELSYYKLYKALQEGNEEEALKQYSTYLETQDNVELQAKKLLQACKSLIKDDKLYKDLAKAAEVEEKEAIILEEQNKAESQQAIDLKEFNKECEVKKEKIMQYPSRQSNKSMNDHIDSEIEKTEKIIKDKVNTLDMRQVLIEENFMAAIQDLSNDLKNKPIEKKAKGNEKDGQEAANDVDTDMKDVENVGVDIIEDGETN